MKKIFTLFLVLASLFSFSQSTTLVISQFYGAGGNTGAVLNADYVELHNISTSPISIAGYTIQYASATSTAAWTGVSPLPAASIPAGGYYLIQMSAPGANGAALPTPDYVSSPTIAMSGTSGKLALVNGLTALNACPVPSATVIDMVGYGTANCFETAATAVLTPTTGGIRNNNGCDETDNNGADFTVGTPAPRNSASPVFICSGSTSPTLTASALTSFGNICVNITAGPNSFTITGTNLTTADVTVGPLANYTFSTTSGGTYSNSLSLPQTGGGFSQTIFVKFTPTAIATYDGNIPLNGGGVASATNVPATGSGVNLAPSPTTGPASSITFTSATLAGTIASLGCSALTGYGIEYSTVNGFLPGTGTVVPSTNLTGADFSSDLSLLTPGTTYYYIAYATNASGTEYGVQLSFTTGSTPVPTLSVSGAIAFGSVCINTTAGPNSFDITGALLTTADVVVGPLAGYTFSTTSGGTYTNSLTLTQPGGAYSQSIFVKFDPTAIASYNGTIPVTGGGTASGTNVPVTGAGVNSAPSVTTGGASAILSTSATLAGNISAIGCSAVTAYGIEYSLVNGFTPGTGTVVASTNLSGADFSSDLSLLTPGTTYYYVAFTTNAAGTGYGLQQSFTTEAPPPATLAASSLTIFGPVCLNTTAGPESFSITGINLTATDIVVGPLTGYTFSATAGGTYTDDLTLSQPGGAYAQTVYVQFTPTSAVSFDGNIPVTGGGSIGITVPASGTGSNSVSTVITGGIDSTTLASSEVFAKGAVPGIGCSPVTTYGIEYSSYNGFANGSGSKSQSTNLSGTDFSSRLSGLIQSTTYYYKAYAVNSGGISYGDQQSFRTSSIPEGLIIYSTPIIRGSDLHYSFRAVKTGHYAARIFNHVGQLVYQKDMILQLNFIDDHLILPGKLPIGMYIFQIYNHEYKVQKTFMVQ